jgi:hypothetical protein
MKYITLYSGVLALLSFAVAQGPGWCEPEADPDGYVAHLNSILYE